MSQQRTNSPRKPGGAAEEYARLTTSGVASQRAFHRAESREVRSQGGRARKNSASDGSGDDVFPESREDGSGDDRESGDSDDDSDG